MVVILKFDVPVADSELGRMLHLDAGESVTLESFVPSKGESIPFLWIHATDPKPVVESLHDLPGADRVEVLDAQAGRSLVAVDWDLESDGLFRAITAASGHLLRAACYQTHWELTVRFPEHDQLSAFNHRCADQEIRTHVQRIYHGSDPNEDPQFGLSDAQREALALAIEDGYYAIPRQCSTADLAEQLDISSQSVTERLRRAIVNLGRHTILVSRLNEPPS